MKFQKKPVVVDAFQYDGDFMNSKGKYYVPDWAVDAYEKGKLFFETYRSGDKELPGALFVKTLEGEMLVNVGDYVIQGVAGEIYPCKPEIFYRTYEAYGVPKGTVMGGPGTRSFEDKLKDLLTDKSYKPIEWRQSNEEVDGHTVNEVTFKFKQPIQKKIGFSSTREKSSIIDSSCYTKVVVESNDGEKIAEITLDEAIPAEGYCIRLTPKYD